MNFLTFRTLFIIACVLTNFSQHAHAYRDLETGTFITRDPAGHIDGPNEYTYVRQNPWTKFDPLGLYEVNGDAWDPNAEKWTATKDKEGRHVTKVIDGGDELRTDMAVDSFNATQSGDWAAVDARMEYAAARGDGSVIMQYREAVAGSNPQYNAKLNSWGDTMGMLSPADMVNPNRMGGSLGGTPSRAQLLKTKGGLSGPTAKDIQNKNNSITTQTTAASKKELSQIDEFVDLTEHRSAHILNRHRAGAGKTSKTEFPSEWSDRRILHQVSDIATDPNAVRGIGKYDSPYATGTRDGIEIRVDSYPLGHPRFGGQISTAYPINIPANP